MSASHKYNDLDISSDRVYLTKLFFFCTNKFLLVSQLCTLSDVKCANTKSGTQIPPAVKKQNNDYLMKFFYSLFRFFFLSHTLTQTCLVNRENLWKSFGKCEPKREKNYKIYVFVIKIKLFFPIQNVISSQRLT